VSRFAAGLVAIGTAALIAACGSSEPDQETNIVRPELPPKTTTAPERKPDNAKTAPATPKTTGPSFDGPVVKVRIRNGLCTPDSPSTRANKAFQLQIHATDRAYKLVFDGKRRFSVAKGVIGRFVIAAHAADEPVLTIFGEPCAVIRITR
jgi:hypothetical protein